MSDASLADHRVPESVGPYRIVERLGAGGMGVVYRARDERLERWVAIKHIRPGEADLRSRERLRREARTVAGLSHPSIVQVHDIVETGEGDWIVMELVEGETLKELVERRALAMPQVLQLAREIAEGLAEAHAKGIVHRDLKSENVKVTELGHAKILDFGLAKRLWQGRQEESLSVQGAILGTGRAMSPEQALGEEINHLSDLFSFGTLLFETVTRRPPFVGSSLILTMAQICTEEQPSARDLNPEVPRELSNLIDHLLEKDPLQRPQSAGEVVDVLQRIAAKMASRAVRADSGDPSDTAVAPAVSEPSSAWRPFPAVARLPSRSSGSRPLSMSRSSESTAGIFIKTLVETALSDCDELGDRFGDADVFELYSRHDRLARDVLAEHDGLEIQRSDEGFLFLFERPVDAVEFVLAYHERLAGFAAEVGARLRARAAIHLSEIFLRENTAEEIHRGAKPFEVEGLAKLIVSRVVSLARGGQTLMTQEAYDMTRRALVGHPLADRKLHWCAHGLFLFAGVDEAVRIFQVSTDAIASGEGLADAGGVQRVDDAGSGAVLRRPRRRRSLLAVAALLPLIAAGAFYARLRLMEAPAPADPAIRTETSPGPTVKPSLAILGFRNLGGDGGGDRWLSTALEDLLATELAAGGDVRLIAGESVARMRDGAGNLLREDTSSLETLAPDTLQRLHQDFGSDYVILGSYLADDEQLTVQMKLQDAMLGETVASVRESGVATEIGELTGLVFRIGNQVRSKLRLSHRFEAARSTLSDSNEANRLYFSGKKKFSTFDFLGARDDFLEATQLDSGFAMAHAALARTWLTLGYEANAADSGQRAYELAGNALAREDYLLIEGTFHESSGDLAGAIKTQTSLWQFHPDKLEYGVRLAELQVAAGRNVEALATIGELRDLPPPMNEDPQIDLVEAKAAKELGRHEQVVQAAGRAIDKGRARQNSPLVAQALRVRGRGLVELKRLEEGARDLEEALVLYREVGDDLGLGQTLYSLAFMEQGQRNPSSAERYLRQALDIFQKKGGRQNIVHAQHGLAYMIQRKGELTAARQLLEESLQVARGLASRKYEVWVLDTLSFVLLQMGELSRAEKMIQELIAVSRETNDRRTESFAFVNLGQVKLSAGKLDDARSVFEAQYRLAEESNNRHVGALALSGLGAVHYARGDLEEAEEAFAGYMKIQTLAGEWGDQSLTEPYYASTLLALGRPGEALDMAIRIAERFEAAEQPIYQSAALRIAAEALWQQGRREKAREKLDEALAVAGVSENPEVRLRLELTSIRFLAANGAGEAPRQLRPLIFEASRFNLKPVELEALLVLGEIELGSDSEDELDLGRARLEALADEASRLGFDLLAQKAEARLGEALRPVSPPASRPAL